MWRMCYRFYDLGTLRAFCAKPLANNLFTQEATKKMSGIDIITHIRNTPKMGNVHCCNCKRFLNNSAARKKPIMEVVKVNMRRLVNGRHAITPANKPIDAVI